MLYINSNNALKSIESDCDALCYAGIENERNKSYKGHRALWRSVIMQSMVDIENNSSRTENMVAKAQAISWFLYASKNFYAVCAFAEYDPDYVIEKAKTLISKNKKKSAVIRVAKEIYEDITYYPLCCKIFLQRSSVA